MAKQNFLSGGYIGKLGGTVGQRWKDKKIIRTYVKPSNPNTPQQQSAREMFATANRLAQQAMLINGHTGVWDSSKCPEYSQRVGQAMRRLRAGYTEDQSLPLYPEGSLPEVHSELLNYTIDNANQTVTFTVSEYGISEPTEVEISFYSPLSIATGDYTEYIIHGTASSPNKTFTIDFSNNNTTDSQAVRTFFKEAIEFGFFSMYATFYDMLRVPLTEIRLQRGYAVNNTLYDFNKDLPLVETNNRVTIQRQVSQNTISGTALAPVDEGYPFIVKAEATTSYWISAQDNSSETSFIELPDANGVALSLPATSGARFIKTSSTQTYYLQMGSAGRQLYKDTSTVSYPDPTIEVVINSYQVNTANKTVVFTMSDFGISVPTRANVTFYSVEAYQGTAFTANTINATVSDNNRTVTIDYSNNNTQTSQAVRTLFEEALNYGFLSLYPRFYDAQNTELAEITLRRGYELNNTLYDFNKDLPIVETNNKVMFVREITGSRITGTILPPTTTGYPFVSKVESRSTYWENTQENLLSTAFISISGATGANFTLTAPFATGNLKTTASTAYSMQKGNDSRQIYKDISTANYDNPMVTVTATAIEIDTATNCVLLTFDNPNALQSVPKFNVQFASVGTHTNLSNTATTTPTLTRQANGKYMINQALENPSGNETYAYISIVPANASGTPLTNVVINPINVDGSNIKILSAPPTKVTTGDFVQTMPIDVARANVANYQAYLLNAAGNPLYLTIEWLSASRVLQGRRNFNFTTSNNPNTVSLKGGTASFNTTARYMRQSLLEVQGSAGNRRAYYNFKQEEASSSVHVTTSWAPANQASLPIQVQLDDATWISFISIEIQTPHQGMWQKNLEVNQVVVPPNGSNTATMQVVDITPEWDVSFVAKPTLTLYDANRNVINNITATMGTPETDAIIYFDPELNWTNIRLNYPVIEFRGGLEIYLDYEVEQLFYDKCRLNGNGEIYYTSDDVLACYYENGTATPSTSQRIIFKVEDNLEDRNDEVVMDGVYYIVSGAGYGQKVYKGQDT